MRIATIVTMRLGLLLSTEVAISFADLFVVP